MADLGGILGGVGGAVDSLFSGIGSLKAAGAYTKASQIALQNAQLSTESTAIQQTQAARKVYQSIGGQEADVAGAGFAASGSALDLLRSSAEQGALQKQLIGVQGIINTNSYEQQATAYQAQAAASKSSGIGGIFSSVLKIGATIASFSDERLKTDLTYVGPSHIEGIGIWLWRFPGDARIYQGVRAQEVAAVRPDCVREVDGFLAVDYSRLGIEYKEAA